MKKALKRIGCAALAVSTIAIGALSLTACTTKRPEVEIQLSFNEEEYTLQYTLYRKYAPNTVNHFLALAENGYYDGLCVHNYLKDSKMQMGAYTYDKDVDEDGGLVYKQYFETVKGYKNFPASVWMDDEGAIPTYTLYGEFKNNDFVVENGDFKTQEFGALSMYYTKKPTDAATVYVKKVSDGKLAKKDYHYNSATSVFNISLYNTTDYYYCTFGTLDNPDVLKELQSAIEEYKKNYEEGESFTAVKSIKVNTDDPFVSNEKDGKETFSIPDSPIIINYVKVKKY